MSAALNPPKLTDGSNEKNLSRMSNSEYDDILDKGVTKIAQKGNETMQEIVTEFILFVTSEA